MSSQKVLPDHLPWEDVVRHPLQPKPSLQTSGHDYWRQAQKISQQFSLQCSQGIPTTKHFIDMVETFHTWIAGRNALPKYRALATCQNGYYKEANFCLQIARFFLDPYCVTPKRELKLALANIPKDFLPVNQGPFHTYPSPKGLMYYFEAAFSELQCLLSTPSSEVQYIEKVATFYQYLVNARPFAKHNNSIFMILVNTLLRKRGLEGLSHYALDHLAHRLHPNNFRTAFLGLCWAQRCSKTPHTIPDHTRRKFYQKLWRSLFSKKENTQQKLHELVLEFSIADTDFIAQCSSALVNASSGTLFPLSYQKQKCEEKEKDTEKLFLADWSYLSCPIDRLYVQTFQSVVHYEPIFPIFQQRAS